MRAVQWWDPLACFYPLPGVVCSCPLCSVGLHDWHSWRCLTYSHWGSWRGRKDQNSYDTTAHGIMGDVIWRERCTGEMNGAADFNTQNPCKRRRRGKSFLKHKVESFCAGIGVVQTCCHVCRDQRQPVGSCLLNVSLVS